MEPAWYDEAARYHCANRFRYGKGCIMNVSIIHNAKISAMYYGLLLSDYDYYAFGKEPALVATLEAFRARGVPVCGEFFSQARQNTCEVYPFWPRAALLETASFYVDADGARFTDYEAYRSSVMETGNLRADERGEAFWNWIAGFPEALSAVLADAGFREYLAWENGWVAEENTLHRDALARISGTMEKLLARCASPVREIKAILCPIKCFSGDFFSGPEAFYSISGIWSAELLVHEFLHGLAHPAVAVRAETILARGFDASSLDASYFLEGDSRGKLNAFEDLLVRAATARVVEGGVDIDLEALLETLLRA